MALIEDLAVAGLFGGPHGCDPPVSAPDRIGLERLGNLCISLNPSLRAKPPKADSSLREKPPKADSSLREKPSKAESSLREKPPKADSSLRAKPPKADSSLRAQRSNPFLLANQPLMDYRVAMPLAMTTSADLP